MKNNSILLIAFFALMASGANAQKTLSPQVRPYAANWTYTLVKAMNAAGFDMPTMSATAPLPALQNPSSALRLDSTKTFYGYGFNGTPDSTPLVRVKYQYPSPQVLVVTEEQFDNGTWLTLNRNTQTTDDLGRLVDVFAELYDPATQTFVPDSRLEIYPHGTSLELVDSFFTFGWNPSLESMQPLLINWNTFNNQDQLLESVSKVLLFNDPLLFREVYAYDINGDNHLIESFATIDGQELPSGRTDISYFDHLPIETTTMEFDGGAFIPETRVNMAYTLFGALRRQLDFTWNADLQTWYLGKTTDLAYDDEQRLAGKETAFLPLNAPEEREYVAYAYVEGENLYTERLLLWDDELFDWVLAQKKYYYYSGGTTANDPEPRPVQTLLMSPNPTVGPVHFPFGEEVALQVFDMAGQQIKSVLLQPGQPLDLSNLPAGIYHLRARDPEGWYSGKIVKE